MATEETKLAVELAGINGKLDNVERQLTEIATRLSGQVNDHEVRIRGIERIHDQVSPLESRMELERVMRWIDGWNIRLGAILFIMIAIAGFTAWLVNLYGLYKH